jgi:glycosyltransferase involved in cell wall biosynthesis
MKKIAIVIPCYNEEERLKKSSILELIENELDVHVFLCDDGSSDKTLEIITELSANYPKINVIHFEENEGKAHTIYKSFQKVIQTEAYTHFGFLDADFSTESDEFLEMYRKLLSSDKKYIFASRILTLNTEIKRKTYRHIIGRIIITFINLFFHLGIYDTQCGAKIFSREILNEFINERFKTNWLFDIEIFIRLSKKNLLNTGIEHPLKKWRDVNGSKIKKIDFLFILKDIFKLIKVYK